MGGAILHNVGRDGSHNYHVDCKEAILLGFSDKTAPGMVSSTTVAAKD